MNRILSLVFAAWTLSGTAFLFLEPGSAPWWNVIWILLFLLTAYIDLTASAGLATARIRCGLVLLGFAVLLVGGTALGWPLGPLRFTTMAGPKFGGLPALIPVFAAALLLVCHDAADRLLPASRRIVNALVTGSLFTLTLANGAAFLGGTRLWWLWNPWGSPTGAESVAGAFAALFLAAVALSFVFPPAVRLRHRSWPASWIALAALNFLFLGVHLRAALQLP